MNATRRKALSSAVKLLDQAKAILEQVRDDEDSAFNNLPDSLQEGERAQAMQDTVEKFGEVIDGLEVAVAELGEIAE